MGGSEEKVRMSDDGPRPAQSPTLPIFNQDAETKTTPSAAFHPVVYVTTWIALSSSVILFNKWILSTLNFRYPVLLTTWHLVFATIMTQILARTTTVLDGRYTVKMTRDIYVRAIVPIGLFFSLSLICGNLTYLYLSVAFIQMLKATTPVAVLVTSWFFGVSAPNMKVLFNVFFIVIGVIIASFGEIKFVLVGFIFQVAGIMFEAVRLVMVQRLLNSAESRMDPLVSLYYFAPICAAMNGVVALLWEVPKVSMAEVHAVGLHIFLANAIVAFLLNVSVVFLIGRTSSLVLTLCGVLKDIFLVFASMMIFGTIVTPLQFFGYFIALGGLVYYKLGGDQLRTNIKVARTKWSDFGDRYPMYRRLAILAFVFLVIFTLFGGFGKKYVPDYDFDMPSASKIWADNYTKARDRYKSSGLGGFKKPAITSATPEQP